MTLRRSPDIRQHATHEDLLGPATPPLSAYSAPRLDAIIVPASRPAEHLDHAVTLAQAANCRLVILCSHQARADEVGQLLDSRSFSQGTVIDLPAGYGHRWFEFAVCLPEVIRRLPEACAARDTDLSMKRNLGLILARMLGWDRVFFMDDDIRGVEYQDLRRTVAMLGQQYYSVGMRVNEFPDNSVVCHAHRATGEPQDTFVSGSVLAIDCTALFGFFPNVYNEDWLFFYNDTVEGRLACSGWPATQLAYDPFDDPRRAAEQEFGDVMAEGLYALLHHNRNAAHATREYWSGFLDARRQFLAAVIARAARAPANVREKMLASVAAAQKCSAQIEPALCVDYVRLWRKDLVRWEETLKKIPRFSSLNRALSELGLGPAAGGTDKDASSRAPVPAMRKIAVDAPAAFDRAGVPPSALTLTAATIGRLPAESTALAEPDALADTDQMRRLETMFSRETRGPVVGQARRPVVGQARRVAAMRAKVGVGMLVVAGVIGVLVVVTIAWA